MPILYEGTEDQNWEACNRSALRRKGWKPIEEFDAANLADAQYLVAQYDENICDPQVLVGLAEYYSEDGCLKQVGNTTGFRLDRIDYFMVITPTPQEYSARRFENTFNKTLLISGLAVSQGQFEA